MNPPELLRPAILTVTYPPDLNGVSVSTGRLADNLRAHGIETFVVTSERKNTKYPDFVFQLPSLAMPQTVSQDIKLPYRGFKRTYDFLLSRKVNLINSTDPFITGPMGVLLSRLLRIPHAYSFHTHFESYPYYNFPGSRGLIRRMTRGVLRYVNAVSLPTAKMKEYVSSLNIQTPLTTLINIPAVSHLSPQPKNTALLQRYNLAPGDFVFITFGRVNPEKGIETAIRHLAPLMRTASSIKYLVAGLGPDIERLRKISGELGIEAQVIFTGRYERLELGEVASLGDCFLFTSRSDTQAITILEAMCLGLPVISIDDDCVDYILKNNYNGIKCPEDQLTGACLSLAADPVLRRKLSDHARASARALNEEAVTREWLSWFEQVRKDFQTPKKQPAQPSILRQSLRILSLQSFRGGVRSLIKRIYK